MPLQGSALGDARLKDLIELHHKGPLFDQLSQLNGLLGELLQLIGDSK